MLKKSPSRKKKTTAQAMVEFALALPVLLLVVYGLIETGRLIFIYASVVTAARNAVRYGSATGLNSSGTPYYQDCSGITAAADSVAFITTFSAINITYDAGLGTDGNPITLSYSCPSSPLPQDKIQNGWRINVSVSAQYAPIVPLVPFGPFTITSMSSRTLLNSVSIGITAPAIIWSGSGGINLQVTTDVSTYSQLNQKITFTYIITNRTGSPLSGKITVTDSLTGGCSVNANNLVPDATISCTATYTITQADLDNGSISTVAYATVSTYTSNTVNVTLYAIQRPSLSLTKTASTSAASPGTKISYTYVITNTGNVTLPSITTTDNILGSVCSGSSLAPGAQLPCTVPYTIPNPAPSTITNTAQATAPFGTICPASNPCKSNSVTASVVTTSLYLFVNAPTQVVGTVGTTISYTFSLENVTNQSMLPNFTVSATTSTGGAIATSPNPCSTSSLGKGSTVSCSGSYTITQSDIDNGMVTVTAAGYGNSGAIPSNSVTINVIVLQSPGIALTVSASPPIATTVGQVVAYTYTITNSGNITLKAPFSISDNKVTSVDCSKATGPLAPGASTTCTGSYTIAQSDIDAGSVIDQATASGVMLVSGQMVASGQASTTVITYNAPRLALQKTASPTLANSAGQVITYTYTLKNTGNTPLTLPFTVTDNKIGNANCSAAVNPIPIGGSTICTGSYTITVADITAKSVTNTATATAMAGANTLTSNQATATVQTGAIACDPRHSGIQTAPFSMTIFNESASATITILQIQIYFNTNPIGQFISTMQYGGVTIWAGATTGSPGVFTAFTGDVTLQAGKNKLLGLTFNKNYIPSNPPIERIVVTFAESGCPVLDSNNNSQLP